MAKIVSSPATMWVQPPRPAPAGFTNGAQTGSFDAATDTWTPGTSGGVVNQASWALVPSGRWVQVAGTRIDGLTSTVVAAVPSWNASTLAWQSVMNAWNGFAIDGEKCRVWLVAAGGHADSSNNGIYRFDAYKMAWSVEKMPSDRAAWSDQYRNLRPPQSGGYTMCYESTQQRDAKAAAGTLSLIDDWDGDELFWDRRPTSRHVYSSVVYVPASDELVMLCRRLWRFSLVANEWTYKRRAPIPVDGAEVYGVHDERTNEYLFGGAGDGIYASLSYNLSTNTWNNAPWSPWSLYTGADVRVGRKVVFFNPVLGDRTNIFPGKYWTYDLDSRAIVNSGTGNVQFAGGLSTQDFRGQYSPLYDGGCSLAYVPGLNRYWITLFMKTGMRWLQLDPTTTPWTLSPLTFQNEPPPTSDKPCRKMVYFADLNAVLYFSSGDRPGYIYKL